MTDLQILLVMAALTLILYLVNWRPVKQYLTPVVSVAILGFFVLVSHIRSIPDDIAAVCLASAMVATWAVFIVTAARRS
jgi:hypothetical protein